MKSTHVGAAKLTLEHFQDRRNIQFGREHFQRAKFGQGVSQAVAIQSRILVCRLREKTCYRSRPSHRQDGSPALLVRIESGRPPPHCRENALRSAFAPIRRMTPSGIAQSLVATETY